MNKEIFIFTLTIISLAVIAIAIGIFFFPARKYPYVQTSSRIDHIDIAIALYKEENGNWPDTEKWKEQISLYVYKTKESKNENLWYMDQWGHEIKYLVKEWKTETVRLLYSCGPNGIDEKGTGDDIVREVK